LPAAGGHELKRNDDLLLHDAWQSDELKDFHSIVQWESWDPNDGGQS
jgi:hypothetical protein